MKIKQLDFVLTPLGSVAMVKEVSTTQGIRAYSLAFIYRNHVAIEPEKTAWWNTTELTKLSSLGRLLAENMCHPFGDGKKTIPMSL